MAPKGEKRAAPISASAFSFSLTPVKKRATATGLPPAPVASPAPTRTPAPTRSPVPSIPVIPLPPAPPRTTPRRPVSDLLTPRKPQPQPESGSPARPPRRITDALSPFRVDGAALTHSIGTLPQPPVIRERERRPAEDAIGVSPRRFRGSIQYKGPGLPPSMRLATLLSANTTALVLFYTAQAHAIRGCALRHVRGAPARLAVREIVGGRTHAAVMLRCAVLAWPDEEQELESVTLVLQALPPDCPPGGVDARTLVPGKAYEVGLWGPWTRRAEVVFASRYVVAPL